MIFPLLGSPSEIKITPEQVKAKTIKRFWSKINFAAIDECWEWTSYKTQLNYGRFAYAENGKAIDVKSHRYLFMILFGNLPRSIFVCHTCDNPICVNPNHLFAGTPKMNSMDMAKKRRNPFGSKKYNAKLDEKSVMEMKRKMESGVRVREVAKEYGVAWQNVFKIKSGKLWSHVK